MEPQQVEYVKTIRRRKKHIFREKELKRNREEENIKRENFKQDNS